MATYVNDLRLKEIGTGESSGTWGTETNTNLELIGDALGFGTEGITTNADTHTTTVADGSVDAGRAMYIKYTGTLDSACTVTIGPNTINRMHFIENATTGSQNLVISQGTGSNVTIPAGDVKAVYLDGAGSGAAVADAFTDLNLAGTTTVDALNVSGALTGSSTIQGTTITATTAFVPDASDGAALGTSSLEFSDLFLADAAVINLGDDQDTTLTHVADTGILLNSTRQLQFGDSGTYIHQSADGVLDLVSDTEIEINATTIDMNGAADVSGALTAGTVNGLGILADTTNFVDSILISQNASTGTLDSASNNTGLGDSVFAALTSGDANTAIGKDAMNATTTGSNNVGIGTGALDTNTTGNLNTAVGRSAMFANTTGSNNVAVGFGALDANTTADNNTALGYNALTANTTGDNNIALGSQALLSNTTGIQNIAIGVAALDAATTANDNTAIGHVALSANTTGAANTSVGSLSMQATTTGNNNVAVGYNALNDNTTGSTCTAIGSEALAVNTTGQSNTAVGNQALDANTEASHNTAIGKDALGANTTGTQNVAVGSACLDANSTGSNLTAVGYEALSSNTTGSHNTAVGTSSSASITTGNLNVSMGLSSLGSTTTGSNNIGIGYNSLAANTTANNNTSIGTLAMASNTTGALNVALGALALDANTTTSDNTSIGYASLSTQNGGNGRNTALGSQALNNLTTGDSNVAVGYFAGVNTTTGTGNVFVGGGQFGVSNPAGTAVTTGDKNTLIGNAAGNAITTGSGNTVLGGYTGNSNSLDIRTESNHVVLSSGDGTPRLIVTDNDKMMVGTTTINGAIGNFVAPNSVNTLNVFQSEGSGSHTLVAFNVSGGATAVGSITTNSSTTAYNTTSDYRLKENVDYTWDATTRLKQLKPARFNFIADSTNTLVDGFLAHEVSSVVPEAITGEKDGTEMQGIDQSKLVPLLVKTIQELEARITALES